MFFFFFLLALSFTLLAPLHSESTHLFGWGVALLWVIYTSYSVQVCELLEGRELNSENKCFVSFSGVMLPKALQAIQMSRVSKLRKPPLYSDDT